MQVSTLIQEEFLHVKVFMKHHEISSWHFSHLETCIMCTEYACEAAAAKTDKGSQGGKCAHNCATDSGAAFSVVP